MATISYVLVDNKLEPGLPDGTLDSDSTAIGTFGTVTSITLNGVTQTIGTTTGGTDQVITPILGDNDYEVNYDLVINDGTPDTLSVVSNKVPDDWDIFTVGASPDSSGESLFFGASPAVATGDRVLYRRHIDANTEVLIDPALDGTYVVQAETPGETTDVLYFIWDASEGSNNWSTLITLEVSTVAGESASGDVVSQSAIVSGTATVFPPLEASGDVVSQSATVTGVVDVQGPITVTGDVQSQSAVVNGTATVIPPAGATGDVKSQSATVAGVVTVNELITASGNVQSGSAIVTGTGDAPIVASGQVKSQSAKVVGRDAPPTPDIAFTVMSRITGETKTVMSPITDTFAVLSPIE